jgi:Ca2+-binding RTX toxin-like protein
MNHDKPASDGIMAGLRARGHRRKPVGCLGLLTAASLAVVGSVASPSHAAGPTASVTAGNTVHYVGNGFANKVLVTTDLPGTVALEEPVAGISKGPGCTQVSSIKVRCEASTSGSPVKSVLLDLGAGFDKATVQTSVPTTVRGDADNDEYVGASSLKSSNVTFDGGTGIDTVDYRNSSAGVAVDIDGVGDDGRLGKDADNILTSVENLSGSNHSDSLRGNAGSNRIFGGLGADALRGGAGDDEIVASESNREGSEADQADLSCGKGTDTITVDAVDPAPAECETVRRVS